MESSTTENEVTLKSLLEERGMTQEELARRVNLSWRTVSQWCTGKSVPRLDNAALLASELGVSLKTLCLAMKIDVSNIPDD